MLATYSPRAAQCLFEGSRLREQFREAQSRLHESDACRWRSIRSLDRDCVSIRLGILLNRLRSWFLQVIALVAPLAITVTFLLWLVRSLEVFVGAFCAICCG